MTRCWYERYPRRLRTELMLIRAKTNARVYWLGSTLALDDEIRINPYEFGIQIVVPDNYPFEPPAVYLRYPTLPVTAKIHRYNDSSLCLFGPDEWVPSMTIVAAHSRAVLWAHSIVAMLVSGEFIQPTPPRRRR